MRNVYNLSVNDIIHHIINHDINGYYKTFNYIILGRSGPTGKTTLCKYLNDNGFNATEISESIYHLLDYRDDKNHFIEDIMHKQIIIILNRSVRE
jgi:hypothetical protein